MPIRDHLSFRNRPFSHYLLACMLVIVLVLVGYLTISMYFYTKGNFEQDAFRLQHQTEENINEAVHLADESFNLFDDTLNAKMKDGFSVFLAEYERSGRNPAAMNLSTVKEQLGSSFDLYVINASGVIEYTTYPPELGQDFRNVPYFYDYLTKIRLSDGFYPDHVVRDKLGQGQFRKFAYMPTPDHSCVLELGLAGSQFENSRMRLNLREIIRKMSAENPYIESFHVYDTMGQAIEEPGYVPDQVSRGRLNETIAARKTLEFSKSDSSLKVRYLFIDLMNPAYGSDASRIVELTYNTALIQDALNRLLLFYAAVALVAIGLGTGIALVLSRHLTIPVEKIVRDVDRIAHGDLETKVETTHTREFSVLEQSINSMVASMKQAITKIGDSETFLRTLLDHLPVAVFVKKIPEGTYIYWNETSEKLFGITAKDVLGKTDGEIFAGSQADLFRSRGSDMFGERIEIRDKVITSKTLGRRIVHTIITPMRDSQDKTRYLLGIIEDITEENLNRKLNLLSSITRHDVLNHLTTILTSIELALARESDPAHRINCERIAASVEAIRQEITFMGMIQGLGVNAPYWQPVKQSFMSMIPLLPKKKIDIRADLSETEIHADALLPKVFYNLMENSLKYGGEGITAIRLSARESGKGLEIMYEDNGPGIAPEEKEKVFQFGYGKGTGLGLFLIREILGTTGITIRETGESGRGVRFVITVPEGGWRRVS
jgi:PAS domain S-box-containing protein